MASTILFAGSTTPVEITDTEVNAFVRGEIPPAIAERFVAHGMPRRGLVRFTMQVDEAGTLRTVGPNLARRAGTLSSAL